MTSCHNCRKNCHYSSDMLLTIALFLFKDFVETKQIVGLRNDKSQEDRSRCTLISTLHKFDTIHVLFQFYTHTFYFFFHEIFLSTQSWKKSIKKAGMDMIGLVKSGEQW